MTVPDADEPAGLVCIGASAGGLRSLESLLADVPAGFAWPILVSQHLAPEHASLMPQILARATALHVREAVPGEAPTGGTVYTCPSDGELGVAPDGRLTVRPLRATATRIDHLFATAAFAHPSLVVAVVLSGTGRDGAAGSLVVKMNGGAVLAESDESARESSMPHAAIRAGTVDATRSASALAALLVSLADGGLHEARAAAAVEVRAIAATLTAATGTAFVDYRPATLRRRIEQRRALRGSASLAHYHSMLRSDADERAALVRSLLIPVTEFFRDPPAWAALREEAVARVAARSRAGHTVRAWCAGCASGEEAYTLAILLADAGVALDRLEIVATDLDEHALEHARSGEFEDGRMSNVHGPQRAAHFTPGRGTHRVSAGLKSLIDFRRHDLTRDPPPEGPFDVIVCRNVLIYFENPLQERLLASFASVLRDDGILMLGRSETIPGRGFETVARAMRVFRRVRPPGAAVPVASARIDRIRSRGDHASAADVRVDATDALVLVLDETGRITTANARAHGVLGVAIVGALVLDVFPQWRGSPVEDAMSSIAETGRGLHRSTAPTPAGLMDVDLEPMVGTAAHRLLLVARPASPRATSGGEPPRGADAASTTEDLQTANEELAAANEELQASNEELSSLNEEFLSTNQSLASTNEELTTDSAATRARLILQSLLTSRDATVACDAAGRVLLCTPMAVELLGLPPSVPGGTLRVDGLGIAPAAVEEWLAASARTRAPVVRRHETASGPLEVTVRSLVEGGTTLGWLLTWRTPARPESAAPVDGDPNMHGRPQ